MHSLLDQVTIDDCGITGYNNQIANHILVALNAVRFIDFNAYPITEIFARKFVSKQLYWTAQATEWSGDIAPRDFDTRECWDTFTDQNQFSEWLVNNGVTKCDFTIRLDDGRAVITTQEQNGGMHTLWTLNKKLRNLFLEWYVPKDDEALIELVSYCRSHPDFDFDMLPKIDERYSITLFDLKALINSTAHIPTVRELDSMIGRCSDDWNKSPVWTPNAEEYNRDWAYLKTLTGRGNHPLSVGIRSKPAQGSTEPQLELICKCSGRWEDLPRNELAKRILAGSTYAVYDEYGNMLLDYPTYKQDVCKSHYSKRLGYIIQNEKDIEPAYVAAYKNHYGV